MAEQGGREGEREREEREICLAVELEVHEVSMHVGSKHVGTNEVREACGRGGVSDVIMMSSLHHQ